MSVLLGNGDGTFQTAVDYPAGPLPYGVAVGDFDGDGKADLVVANDIGNNVSVLLGNGNGTFRAAVNYSVGAPNSWWLWGISTAMVNRTMAVGTPFRLKRSAGERRRHL